MRRGTLTTPCFLPGTKDLEPLPSPSVHRAPSKVLGGDVLDLLQSRQSECGRQHSVDLSGTFIARERIGDHCRGDAAYSEHPVLLLTFTHRLFLSQPQRSVELGLSKDLETDLESAIDAQRAELPVLFALSQQTLASS